MGSTVSTYYNNCYNNFILISTVNSLLLNSPLVATNSISYPFCLRRYHWTPGIQVTARKISRPHQDSNSGHPCNRRVHSLVMPQQISHEAYPTQINLLWEFQGTPLEWLKCCTLAEKMNSMINLHSKWRTLCFVVQEQEVSLKRSTLQSNWFLNLVKNCFVPRFLFCYLNI